MFKKGDEVVLIDDWRWQGHANYLTMPTQRRPPRGSLGVIVGPELPGQMAATTVVDFSASTGNDSLTTLSTDVDVLTLAGPSEDEVQEVIQSILGSHDGQTP